MKPKFTMFVAALVLAISATASAQTLLNPLPQAQSVFSLTSLPGGSVIGSGAGGLIVRSSDNGETWDVTYDLNGDVDLRSLNSMCFVDDSLGWIVGGFNGAPPLANMLRTTNGGREWNKMGIEGVTYLYDICMFDSDTGWVVGSRSVLARTTNGGDDWDEVDLDEDGIDLKAIAFSGPTGIAVGRMTGGIKVIRTTDNGVTWDTVDTGVTPSSESGLSCVAFRPGTSTVLAAGTPGQVLRSEDFGATWDDVAMNASWRIESLLFVDSMTAVASCGGGYIIKSTDGGATWSARESDRIGHNLFALTHKGGGVLFAAGTSGMMLRSTDAGDSWEIRQEGDLTTINNVRMFDAQNGALWLSDGKLGKTTDGGATWSYASIPGVTTGSFGDISFFDESHYAVLSADSVSFMVTTANGGGSWTRKAVPDENFSALQWLDALTGFLFGRKDTATVQGGTSILYRTTDGGDNWTRLSIGTPAPYSAFHFFSKDEGILGSSGELLDTTLWTARTTDGGVTWDSTFIAPMNLAILKFAFVDSLHGWFVGQGGAVAGTTDGGRTWKPQVANIGRTLVDVQFVDPLRGWAAGENGNVVVTVDGGTTWQNPQIITSEAWLSVSVIGKKAWVAGTGGVLAVYDEPTPASVPPHLENVPASFALEQNYPNPFNPATTIGFTIPARSMVTLAVYSLLGQRIAMPVHEERDAGSHEIRFDASGLSTGVYFYRLQAGSFSATRKFLFLR